MQETSGPATSPPDGAELETLDREGSNRETSDHEALDREALAGALQDLYACREALAAFRAPPEA
jgi:hypothetical protein